MNDELIRLVKEINQLEYECNVMLTQEYEALLDENITNKQIILLGYLHEHGRLNTSELSKMMGITPSAVSQMLGKLEKDGYIKRSINLSNRKEIIVELDDRGHHYINKSSQVEMSIIERYYSKLDMEDIGALLRITRKLKSIIEEERLAQD